MNLFKVFLLAIFCFFSSNLLIAQSAVLSFVNPTVVGGKFRVTLRMASSGGDFGLGQHNLRFNFTSTALSCPTYTVPTATTGGTAGSVTAPLITTQNYPSAAFSLPTVTGSNCSLSYASIQPNYSGATNSNALPITAAGVDLVTVEWNIINSAIPVDLSWRITGSQPRVAIVDDDKVTPITATGVSLTGFDLNVVPVNAGADVTTNCTNPSATLTASGGGGTYVWSTGATTASINVNPATTTSYSVTATNGTSDNVTVFVDKAVPTANAGADATVTCNAPTTNLAVSGNGNYLWSTGETTQSISVSPNTTTTYVVTVTASNGCMASDEVIVFANKSAPLANAGADATISCTALNATLTATGGVSYLWNTGATTTSITVSPTITTTYAVTVTDANGCTASDEVIVFYSNSAPTANAGADITTFCSGLSATLTATGGSTYAWSNGASGATITVNPTTTTTYTVTVTGANGCTASDAVLVTVQNIASSALSFTNPTVSGNKFRVNLRVASVCLPFSMGSSNLRFNFNIAALANPVIISDNFPSPDFGATTTTGSAIANGILSINTSYNGTANANTLPITASGIDLVTMEFDIINASLTSNLEWRITTTNPKTAIVDDDKLTAIPNATFANLNVSLQGVNAGADVTVNCINPTKTLTATNGANYLWSTGETTASITVSPTTTTTYSVTSTNGSTSTDQVVVTADKTAPIVNVGADITVNCTNPSTTLSATGVGSYLWSSGQSTQAITVDPNITKTYTVTVTGANGCTASDEVIVFADKVAPTANAGADASVNCSISSVTLNASGGTTYNWSNGANTASTSVSPSSTTTYVVTVTGANGCKASDEVVVFSDKTAPVANAGADITIFCSGLSATLTATGGSTYAWSNSASGATITVNPTTTTTYTVTVTGANGCTASDAVLVTVQNTASSALSFTNPTVSGNKFRVNLRVGSICLPFSMGSSNLRFNFNTAALANPVIISDNYPSPEFGATTTTGSSIATGVLSINTSYNGTANANTLPITASGIDLVTMEFDIINASLTSNLEWRITGANPKTAIVDDDKLTIIPNGTFANLNVSLQAVNAGVDKFVDCTNPTVTLTATNGANYVWSTGETTASITVSPATTTTYSVTSTNGSTSTDQVVVTADKTLPNVNAGSDTSVNCTSPNASLTATGGLTYLWDNGATTATIVVSPTVTTTYTVKATGANGCIAFDGVVVEYKLCHPIITAKVFLNHVNPSTLLMDNYLSTLVDFPLSDPYASSVFNTKFIHVNNSTVATTTSAVVATTGNNAIIDWVFLSLRTGTSGSTSVEYTKAALLQADGDIVATDGVSPVSFPGAPAGNYYVSVRHRNNLGFRTTNTYALSGTVTNFNFTNNSVPLYGSSPLFGISTNLFVMNGGDSEPDGSIDAFDAIFWEIQNGYFDVYNSNADYNYDGSVDAFDAILWEINNGKFEELD